MHVELFIDVLEVRADRAGRDAERVRDLMAVLRWREV